MKRSVILALNLICLFGGFLTAKGGEEGSIPESSTTTDIKKISETFGHLIAKNLSSVGDESGVSFDIVQIIKGLQDATQGRQAPMTEAECMEAITASHAKMIEKVSSENLKSAESFLNENKTKKGVISLEEGKVQYKILKEGKELPAIDEHSVPLLTYSVKLLNRESAFAGSKEPEVLHLEEAIPGFAKGIIGMRKGEVREIYIHPELGYGTNLGYGTKGEIPQNSLLTFQVEIVEVNAPPGLDKSEMPSISSFHGDNPEIAHPTEEVKFLR